MPSAQETKEKNGLNGLRKREQILEELETKKTELINKGLQKLEEQEVAAIDFLMAQVTPSGADILGENVADFALLEHNLITDEEQLSRILSRHDNTAFRIAASQYANKRGWQGFDFGSMTETAKEYIEHIFQYFKFAIQDVNGLSFMQYVETRGELERIARNFGLEAEYAAGLEIAGIED